MVVNDDCYEFVHSTGAWISPAVKGTRPPPCNGFTLTSIDSHRAVLFGGTQPGRGQVSDLYLIDFNTMVCEQAVLYKNKIREGTHIGHSTKKHGLVAWVGV